MLENVGVEKQTGVSDIADIVLYNLQGRTKHVECDTCLYIVLHLVPACFVQTLANNILQKQSLMKQYLTHSF